MTDIRIDGDVKLHFAVYEPIWMVLFDFIDNVVDFIKIGVFATGAIGGVGKHGDFGLSIGESDKSLGSVFDNGIKLLLGGLFVDAAVGEGVDLVVFLADETAGEELGLEGKVVFVGDEDVTRRVVKARDHRIGFATF